MTDKEKIHQILSSLWKNDDSVGKMCYNQALQDVQTAIDLQEEPVSKQKLSNVGRTVKNWKEPVSEDLGEYINELSKQFPEVSFAKLSRIAVRVAKWQKEHLWKPADGDDLPEIDREVIAILDYDFGHYKVVYAHRPNPNGWDGKNIDTNEVTHYTPKLYDKGGWNQPYVLYWLDAKLPYEEK